MKFFFLWLLLISGQLQPAEAPRVTVRDCLLRYGDSHAVPDKQLMDVYGLAVWAERDIEAMRSGELIDGWEVETDTGKRRLILFTHEGRLYLFVYRHPEAPLNPADPSGPKARSSDGWHGSCLLWLNP